MSYYCQNCLASISLDHTLRNISDQQLQLLVSKSSKPPLLQPLPARRYVPQDRLAFYNQALLLSQTEAELRQSIPPKSNDSCDSNRSFIYIHDDEEGKEEPDIDHNNTLTDLPEKDTILETDEQLPDFSKVKSLNEVFRILLTNQDVTHPMCKDCANLLTENYKLKFDHSQREKEQYASFLKKLKDRSSSSTAAEAALDTKLSDTENELEELRTLEQQKLLELEALESLHTELLNKISLLDDRLKDLNETQLSELFHAKNTFNSNLQLEQDRLDQVKAMYKKHLNQLDRLRNINMYTSLFEILFDSGDGFGRINGCRLGYRVPWSELNVSLGHVARLILFLSKRLNLLLNPYQVVAMGLKSYIVKQGSMTDSNGNGIETQVIASNSSSDGTVNPSSPGRHSTILPLYSSNEFTLGKLFNYNSVDVSMIALLDILSLFERNLVNSDCGLAFPYVINVAKGLIGGRSIRISSNGPWTEACRFLLIDVNWILSYVSAQPAHNI